MTFRIGAVQSLSKKQKLNTRSSMEAKLVGADDVANQMLWTKHFMEAKDTQSKRKSYIRITRAPFYCKRMEGKLWEAVTSFESEVFFPHGSSREREPKDNLLSHQ